MVEFEYEEKIFLGINWKVTLSGNDFSVKTGEVRGGLVIIVYKNKNVGMIAFACIDNPENIKIKKEKYNDVLAEIRKNDASGKPILICCDNRYKDLCSEWNDGNNTIFLLNEFENMFL